MLFFSAIEIRCFISIKGIPVDVIYELFKLAYHMYVLEVDAADSGHAGVSRPRIYILLSHLDTGVVLTDPVVLYQRVAKELAKRIHTTPSDYWCALDWEVEQEAMEMAAKRKIQFQPDPRIYTLTYTIHTPTKHKCIHSAHTHSIAE